MSGAGGWTVRRAELADAAGIARVSVASWRAAYEGLMRAESLAALSVDERARQWRERLGDEDNPATHLVVEQMGAIAGFASVGPSRDDDLDRARVGELWALYVDPVLWGKGIGAALFTHAAAELRARGHAKMVLWVLTGNLAARQFYERQGMRADGAEKAPVEDGEPLPHVRYHMPLR